MFNWHIPRFNAKTVFSCLGQITNILCYTGCSGWRQSSAWLILFGRQQLDTDRFPTNWVNFSCNDVSMITKIHTLHGLQHCFSHLHKPFDQVTYVDLILSKRDCVYDHTLSKHHAVMNKHVYKSLVVLCKKGIHAFSRLNVYLWNGWQYLCKMVKHICYSSYYSYSFGLSYIYFALNIEFHVRNQNAHILTTQFF